MQRDHGFGIPVPGVPEVVDVAGGAQVASPQSPVLR